MYRIYGHNLLPKLEALGFSVGYVRQAFKRWGVVPMDMIVCRKDAPLPDDRSPFPVRFDREWPR